MAIEKRLTALQIKSLGEGRHPDGGGLYLDISPGRARWLWRYQYRGQRRDMGLGTLSDVTLAQARASRDKWRARLQGGEDPIEARKRDARGANPTTFGEASEAYARDQLEHYRHERHREQWSKIVDDHAGKLKDKAVEAIDTADVLAVLKPIWQTKPATARKLRTQIEAVLDAARARGQIDEGKANPARWRGHLEKLLSRQKATVRHHAAMPYEEVPAFVRRLRDTDSIPARALEFVILTATRTTETLGAQWDEFDFAANVWTIPAERMKAKKLHRVPLTERMLAILADVGEVRTGPFPFSPHPRESLSDRALASIMHRWEIPATVHGFRSSFRDWAGDMTHHPREVAEAALAHAAGNATESAYRRGDALDRRRALMAAWSDYLGGDHGSNVVRLNVKR